jgi:chromosome segregation ATPase
MQAEEGKAALTADDSRSEVERALTAACKKGGALAKVGFHGRLGSLGTIDGKYDVAVTTACGALSWLVVDDADAGQACVEFLRANNLGRAKFIMLDKVAWIGERMGAAFAAPEGVPRLFDLVRPRDGRFAPAFYFALRNTLVAADMDQAVRIAYVDGVATHRVVTLTGELIDTTGTMSGGGKAPRRGGMSAAASGAGGAGGSGTVSDRGGGGGGEGALVAPPAHVRPPQSAEEVAEAERQAEVAAAAVADIRARKAVLMTEFRSLEYSLPRLATRITKLEMEVASLNRMKARRAVARGHGCAAPRPTPPPPRDRRTRCWPAWPPSPPAATTSRPRRGRMRASWRPPTSASPRWRPAWRSCCPP